MQGFHPCTPPEPFWQKGFWTPKNLKKYIFMKVLEVPRNFFLPCLQGEFHWWGAGATPLHARIPYLKTAPEQHKSRCARPGAASALFAVGF